MASFLSPEWFSQAGEQLALSPPPGAETVERTIMISMTDVPTSMASALTLTVSPTGVTLDATHRDEASVVVLLSYEDALALSSGTLESATALRDGRIKVRGDLAALTPLGPWLQVVLGGSTSVGED
jgi:hypothetical protein